MTDEEFIISEEHCEKCAPVEQRLVNNRCKRHAEPLTEEDHQTAFCISVELAIHAVKLSQRISTRHISEKAREGALEVITGLELALAVNGGDTSKWSQRELELFVMALTTIESAVAAGYAMAMDRVVVLLHQAKQEAILEATPPHPTKQ